MDVQLLHYNIVCHKKYKGIIKKHVNNNILCFRESIHVELKAPPTCFEVTVVLRAECEIIKWYPNILLYSQMKFDQNHHDSPWLHRQNKHARSH